MTSAEEDDGRLRLIVNGEGSSEIPHTSLLLPPSPLPPPSPSHLISPTPPTTAIPHRRISAKANPRFLSLLLQALVMVLVVFLFFLFMGIAAVVIIHICVAGQALHRCRHRRRHRYRYPGSATYISTPFQDSDDLTNLRFSPVDLQKLPCFTVAESLPLQDCAVCLEAFREGERYRILPGCKHFFHSACIDTWLTKSSACPICRGIVQLKE